MVPELTFYDLLILSYCGNLNLDRQTKIKIKFSLATFICRMADTAIESFIVLIKRTSLDAGGLTQRAIQFLIGREFVTDVIATLAEAGSRLHRAPTHFAALFFVF